MKDTWPLECTGTFMAYFGPERAEKAARTFVSWGLEKLNRYADEDPDGLCGPLTYTFKPRNPAHSDVVVQFDYDKEIVKVGMEDDFYEIDSPDPGDLGRHF